MLDRLSLENSHQKSLRILKKQKQISLYDAFRDTNHQYSYLYRHKTNYLLLYNNTLCSWGNAMLSLTHNKFLVTLNR
jgi:hypothetical protein